MDELKKSLKDFLRIKNYSKHTISNYERDINRFLQYLETKKIDRWAKYNGLGLKLSEELVNICYFNLRKYELIEIVKRWVRSWGQMRYMRSKISSKIGKIEIFSVLLSIFSENWCARSKQIWERIIKSWFVTRGPLQLEVTRGN